MSFTANRKQEGCVRQQHNTRHGKLIIKNVIVIFGPQHSKCLVCLEWFFYSRIFLLFCHLPPIKPSHDVSPVYTFALLWYTNHLKAFFLALFTVTSKVERRRHKGSLTDVFLRRVCLSAADEVRKKPPPRLLKHASERRLRLKHEEREENHDALPPVHRGLY